MTALLTTHTVSRPTSLFCLFFSRASTRRGERSFYVGLGAGASRLYPRGYRQRFTTRMWRVVYQNSGDDEVRRRKQTPRGPLPVCTGDDMARRGARGAVGGWKENRCRDFPMLIGSTLNRALHCDTHLPIHPLASFLSCHLVVIPPSLSPHSGHMAARAMGACC